MNILTHQVCDLCDKELTLSNGINAFFEINMSIAASTIDENTGMVESVATISRPNIKSHMCPDCFDMYVRHMEKLQEQLNPKVTNTGQPYVQNQHSDIPEDKKEAFIAKKNFKAAEGSVKTTKKRTAPPKSSEEAPEEIAIVKIGEES